MRFSGERPVRAPELEVLFGSSGSGDRSMGHSEFVADSPVVFATAMSEPGPTVETEFGVEAAVIQRASPKRVSHFLAGRACARAALDTLAIAHEGIGARPSRAPIFPPGSVGAITHTEGFAAAVVAHAEVPYIGLGIDAEQIGRVDDGVTKRIMSERERRAVAAQANPSVAATAIFGAKESFYKAQWHVTEAWVGFADVEIRFEAGALVLEPASDLAALRRFRWPVIARYERVDDLVVVGCVVHVSD